jgi:hypothetical protein
MSNSSDYENLKKHCELYPDSSECKLIKEVVDVVKNSTAGGHSSPYEYRNDILYDIAEYLLIFTRQSQELQALHYTALATLSKNYKEFPQLTDIFAQHALEVALETDYFTRSTALHLQASALYQQGLFEQADQAFAQAQSLIATEQLQMR